MELARFRPRPRRRSSASAAAVAALALTLLAAMYAGTLRAARAGIPRASSRLGASPAGSAKPRTVSTAGIAADPTVATKYGQLCDRLREISQLSGVSAILGWDEQTMMPGGAAGIRGQQKSALAAVIHEKQTDPVLGELIQDLEDGSGLDCEFAKANCRDAKRDYSLETAKSKDIAKTEAELEADCFNTWVKARQEDDWGTFEPKLKAMFDLKKKVAGLTRPTLPVYDGALDAFERGMPAERLDAIFGTLKKDLIPFVQQVLASPSLDLPKAVVEDEWDVKAQADLCLEVAKDLGFNMDRGRFDVSVHPFTGGVGPMDVRITTRYNPNNWMEGMGGTIHEVGHALYEQGRSEEQLDLPVSRALSMGVHESQSLLWERMVFQGRPFWEYATPIIHKHFPHTKDVSADEFYKAVNRVSAGLIRVDADELTYPLHIILRYQMEKRLFEGSMDVGDVPDTWNKDMKDTLNLDVPSNAKGCMQDVHWSVGAIGYFPSYSLGAMMAAQFYEAAKAGIPDLEEQISKGNFEPLKTWLNEKIHRVGSLYASPDELLTAVTGKALDPAIYVDYLKKKYTDLYNLA